MLSGFLRIFRPRRIFLLFADIYTFHLLCFSFSEPWHALKWSMITCPQQAQWIQLRARNCVSLPAQRVCDICELHSVCAICLCVCDICLLRCLCTTQCVWLCVCDSVRRKSHMIGILWWKSNPSCWIFLTCILIDAYPDIWLDPRSSARCGRLWWAQERVGAIHLEFGMSGTKTQILEFWF